MNQPEPTATGPAPAGRDRPPGVAVRAHAGGLGLRPDRGWPAPPVAEVAGGAGGWFVTFSRAGIDAVRRVH